jgi:hypothetical protein
MAYIAVVHIADHTTAARALDPKDIATHLNLDLEASGARIVGIYEFPNRAELKCSGSCTVKNSGAWHRDPLGFMKCRVCGSRNKRIRKWFAGSLFDWFGANLMEDDAPALFRTPEGYGSRDELP